MKLSAQSKIVQNAILMEHVSSVLLEDMVIVVNMNAQIVKLVPWIILVLEQLHT